MNWDQMEGKWKQMTGSIRERWGKLTDDDLHLISGKREKFLGILQERYGISREQAHKDLDEWLSSQSGDVRTRTSGGH